MVQIKPEESHGSLTPEQRPTITVTKRTDRSTYMWLVQKCVRPFRTKLVTPRKEYPAGSNKIDAHKKAKKTCDVQERMVEDVYVYDLFPHDRGRTAEKKSKRIYYFAGGGWHMPPSSEHWALCAEMARRLPDTTVSVVSYPLAPNSPAPTALPTLLKFYQTALQQAAEAGERVVLAGDSAGGNIILCLTLSSLLEDPDGPCPAALMAISPSTDLRRHNPDIKVLERHDPILTIPFINSTAKKWRNGMDPADPRISPLYADVTPLARRDVRVHGVLGRYDVLSPDGVLFREKCNQAGVKGEWLDWVKTDALLPPDLVVRAARRESCEGVDLGCFEAMLKWRKSMGLGNHLERGVWAKCNCRAYPPKGRLVYSLDVIVLSDRTKPAG